ncbi:MAG: DUF2256 domain-containing protein [Planctomycetota bacterium]|nr:DUF2256 domain-containing protein [Planctomycetota bacterium]
MPNHELPTKVCVRCGRPFAWRKKWERDWAQVKYCSKKCVRGTKSTQVQSGRLGTSADVPESNVS